MRKLLLASGALALAAGLGLILGVYSRERAGGVAWAQRFVRSPFAAGKVLLDGAELQGVVGVEGLEEQCDVIERSDPGTGEIQQMPGEFRTRNIKLTTIIPKVELSPLYGWFLEVAEAKRLEKKAGSVIIYDIKSGATLRQYNFYEGWPCKWYVPDLDSDQSGMAIEKIEIAIEKVERAK